MAISSFEDLEVWQVEHRLVLEVYRITDGLPPSQKYGLASQMQRAAVSVPANPDFSPRLDALSELPEGRGFSPAVTRPS